MRDARLVVAVAALACAAACAPPRLTLPTGAGTPLDNFQAIHDEAIAGCATADALTGELQISGRVAGGRVRGRALFGVARPDLLRLEGLAPFGAPAFILAARGGRATLLLPRDNRVLSDAAPSDVLDALTGAALAPGDVLAILSGCAIAGARPTGGRSYGEWAAIDLEGGARLFARQETGRWTILAATSERWRIEYVERSAGFPSTIRLQSIGEPARVDLSVRVVDLEANVALGPEAFELTVPPDATPIDLNALRESGPLRSTEQP